MEHFDHDVVIVGSGPAGIAAATSLAEAGIKDIVVFEREAEIGGIARHTHHPSYGLLVFKHPMSGPQFIRALVARCGDTRFETNTSVLAIRHGGELDLATPTGIKTIRAHHIVLATGARETPRHARLISGLRPQKIMTTGALQQFIHAAKMRPFQRPVIVGTELVSFSALWTLKSAGIKPVAMIESNSRITAYRPAALFARLLGVPIYFNARITDIGDREQITHIAVETTAGKRWGIACDGVIFSGQFVGENALMRASHLTLCPANQLPQVDQNWFSSDPAISIIGNNVHPADMGDQCYTEGLLAGRAIAALLKSKAEISSSPIPIIHDPRIKMTTPNIVRLNKNSETVFDISLHVLEPFTGEITVKYCGETLYGKTGRYMPARRITLKNIHMDSATDTAGSAVEIQLGS